MSKSPDITIEQFAALLGVTVGAFKNRHRPLIPGQFTVKRGRRVLFTRGAVGALVDALLAEQRERLADGDAAAESGPPSEVMERLRTAKAAHAELDLSVRRGELVPTDAVTKVFSIAATQLRRMGERLTKKYGNELADEICRTLDEAEREVETRFAQPGAGVNHE